MVAAVTHAFQSVHALSGIGARPIGGVIAA